MKTKSTLFTFMVLVFVAIATGCHMEKRLYAKGYHVQFSSKQNSATESKSRLAKKEKPKTVVESNIEYVSEPPIEASKENEPMIAPSQTVKLELNQPQTNKRVTPADSCDEIILKSGEVISGKITEISDTEVRYKRCGMLDGPTMVKKKSDILVMKFKDGTTEVVKQEEVKPVEQKAPNRFNLRNQLSDFSIAGLVLSLIAVLNVPLAIYVPFLLDFCAILGLLCSILAIIFSATGMSRAKIKKMEAKTDIEKLEASRQMRRGAAGLVVGILTLIFFVSFAILIFL